MQPIRPQHTGGKLRAAIAFSFVFALACRFPAQRNPVPALEETGFEPIFDGQSLKDWDFDPDFWRAENGAIDRGDAGGPSAQVQHLLHLEGRIAGRFRIETPVQVNGRNR